MDNCRTHLSHYSIKCLLDIGVKVHFNPKYTPVFNIIGMKLFNNNFYFRIDFWPIKI